MIDTHFTIKIMKLEIARDVNGPLILLVQGKLFHLSLIRGNLLAKYGFPLKTVLL